MSKEVFADMERAFAAASVSEQAQSNTVGVGDDVSTYLKETLRTIQDNIKLGTAAKVIKAFTEEEAGEPYNPLSGLKELKDAGLINPEPPGQLIGAAKDMLLGAVHDSREAEKMSRTEATAAQGRLVDMAISMMNNSVKNAYAQTQTAKSPILQAVEEKMAATLGAALDRAMSVQPPPDGLTGKLRELNAFEEFLDAWSERRQKRTVAPYQEGGIQLSSLSLEMMKLGMQDEREKLEIHIAKEHKEAELRLRERIVEVARAVAEQYQPLVAHILTSIAKSGVGVNVNTVGVEPQAQGATAEV